MTKRFHTTSSITAIYCMLLGIILLKGIQSTEKPSESNYLEITNADNDIGLGRVMMLPAEFGHVPSGGEISGVAAIASPLNACQWIDLQTPEETDQRLIVFVRRGECDFYTKAMNVFSN